MKHITYFLFMVAISALVVFSCQQSADPVNTAAESNLNEDADITAVMSTTPPKGDGCARTPGYWKNHPDDWPVESISIGGVVYTKDVIIDILNTPEGGDKSYTLFRAYVAAFLSVRSGTDRSCIDDVRGDARNWIAKYPPGSDVKAGGPNSPWRDAEPWYLKLDDYNNGLLCAPACE